MLQRFSFAIVLLTISLGAAEVPSRVTFQQGSTVAERPLQGLTEVLVVPPFPQAAIAISIDGQVVTSKLTPPYQLWIDLGPVPVEHRVKVTARAAVGNQTVQWHHLLNRGKAPFGVRLEKREGSGVELEAVVTPPAGDTIAFVEFYDDSALVARVEKPPYVVRLDAPPRVLYATAKTRSGAEASDLLASEEMRLAEAYEVRTVPLLVSVVDRKGSVQTDLPSSAFTILDNGQPGKILEFGKAATQPISIALLLDASASMQEQMKVAAEAAIGFIEKTIRKGDRYALFSIHDVPRRERAIAEGADDVRATFSKITLSGRTALYDAIGSAVRELKDEKHRRAIVIFSDGQDTNSNATFDQTLDLARSAGIPIYVIAFGDPVTFERDFDRLKFLALEAGGFLASASPDSLAQRYAEIEMNLRGQYSIRYQISDASRPNQWRRVRVVLKSPRLTARTIAGYFAP